MSRERCARVCIDVGGEFRGADDEHLRATAAMHSNPMLVIDHDIDSCRALEDHFRARGWNVVSATTVPEALDLAMSEQPSAIITDLFMPDVDPRHFVRAIRSMVDHDVRIIATAAQSVGMFERARRAGADIVLPKPIDIQAVETFLATR